MDGFELALKAASSEWDVSEGAPPLEHRLKRRCVLCNRKLSRLQAYFQEKSPSGRR